LVRRTCRGSVRVGAGEPGPLDAITDVAGVRVGQVTIIDGTGLSCARTGVTVIVPHAEIWRQPLLAGAERINGNGELTGLEWIRESGLLTTPIGLTNTHSVGVVRDTLACLHAATAPERRFSLPVVGETFDGYLNDINGRHVTAEHVEQAVAHAATGPVAEGAVGGGTGMICHDFKGGIGTASRLVAGGPRGPWTLGVLVQANHGVRRRLVVDGVPVGGLVGADVVPLPSPGPATPGEGSIIVVIATDAPLLPHQCRALAKRASFGIARTGGAGEPNSGDFAIAFSTATKVSEGADLGTASFVGSEALTQLYYATIEATEQSIVNALVAARTMTGRDGHTAHALPAELLASVLQTCREIRPAENCVAQRK
jgi:D-aminopeptidase